DRDAIRLPAHDALEMVDDRPLQILVAKGREGTIGGPVPVQRASIVLEPSTRLGPVDVSGAIRKADERGATRGVQGHGISSVLPSDVESLQPVPGFSQPRPQ